MIWENKKTRQFCGVLTGPVSNRYSSANIQQKMKRKYHVSKNRDKKMMTIHFHYILIKSGYMKSLYHNLKEAIKAHNK